jgi:hypothetical protein
MAEFVEVRRNVVEGKAYVVGNVGVGVFIDRYRRSGVGYENDTNPFGYA